MGGEFHLYAVSLISRAVEVEHRHIKREPSEKFHLAIGVADIAASVEDYSERLQAQPALIVPGEYALWRTAHLNFSVRKVAADQVGQLRHLAGKTPRREL